MEKLLSLYAQSDSDIPLVVVVCLYLSVTIDNNAEKCAAWLLSIFCFLLKNGGMRTFTLLPFVCNFMQNK